MQLVQCVSSILRPQRLAGVLVAAAALATAGAASAQIGTGWTQYYPSSKIQLVGTGTYSNSIYTISAAAGEQRAETRVNNDYLTGSRQFEGYITPFDGEGTCMKQTFKSFMLVAYGANGGEFRYYSGTPLGVTGIWGRTYRINTLHYTSTKQHEIWINGSKKLTTSTPEYTGAGWYDKFGVYNVTSGVGQCAWASPRYWKK